METFTFTSTETYFCTTEFCFASIEKAHSYKGLGRGQNPPVCTQREGLHKQTHTIWTATRCWERHRSDPGRGKYSESLSMTEEGSKLKCPRLNRRRASCIETTACDCAASLFSMLKCSQAHTITSSCISCILLIKVCEMTCSV